MIQYTLRTGTCTRTVLIRLSEYTGKRLLGADTKTLLVGITPYSSKAVGQMHKKYRYVHVRVDPYINTKRSELS